MSNAEEEIASMDPKARAVVTALHEFVQAGPESVTTRDLAFVYGAIHYAYTLTSQEVANRPEGPKIVAASLGALGDMFRKN